MEILVAGMFVIIITLILIHERDKAKWMMTEKDLLNRLMARDYREYAQAEAKVLEVTTPQNVVNVEELKKEIQRMEMDREMGIPV